MMTLDGNLVSVSFLVGVCGLRVGSHVRYYFAVCGVFDGFLCISKKDNSYTKHQGE